MLFIALTSAYVVRQGLGGDWQTVRMPRLLWLTTAILLGSSLSLELARSSFNRGLDRVFKGWLTITLLLGVVFLLGQLLAWRQLAAQGIYLNTNPHSSFFYLLSGTHGLHVVGGVIALAVVAWGAWRHRYTWRQHTAVDVAGLYWHFMDGLWVYLLVVLFVWK
jgi:cytochrome c oxidase subunit 3